MFVDVIVFSEKKQVILNLERLCVSLQSRKQPKKDCYPTPEDPYRGSGYSSY